MDRYSVPTFLGPPLRLRLAALRFAARYYLLRCVGSRWSGRSALRPDGLGLA